MRAKSLSSFAGSEIPSPEAVVTRYARERPLYQSVVCDQAAVQRPKLPADLDRTLAVEHEMRALVSALNLAQVLVDPSEDKVELGVPTGKVVAQVVEPRLQLL